MNIIFLDIDGVLNTSDDRTRCGWDIISGKGLEQLKRIIKSTKVDIVLSSAWRKEQKDRNIIKYWFDVYKIPVWIDVTPVIPVEVDWSDEKWANQRADEIREWILGKPIDKAAILDDMPVNLSIPTVNIKLFQTDDDFGLTADIADQVIAFFNT